jgi:hypothetical protein
VLLGGHVSTPSALITDLETLNFPAARYAKFHVDDPKNLFAAWQHIGSLHDLNRLYSCDFEPIRPTDADIYVSLQP